MIVQKYDLFISYASTNKDIAFHVVEKLEERGKKCFVAPRDITGGNEYAVEIVNAISNSSAVLLIFSAQADKSQYVLREVNSAVSRNKTIIPLRIEDFLPSEAMEFYLGPTHWLNAYPKVLAIHLDSIVSILENLTKRNEESPEVTIKGPVVMSNNQLFEYGYEKEDITMREIELDYLCVDLQKYRLDESLEGTLEDWATTTQEFADAGCALIQNDEIIGYSYVLPLIEEEYQRVITGEKMVNSEMIDLYALGGEFNAYITMLAIDPRYSNQELYIMLLKWIVEKIIRWEEENIVIKHVGISVYSEMLKKFLSRMGFVKIGVNSALGDIFEADIEAIKTSPFFMKFYDKL